MCIGDVCTGWSLDHVCCRRCFCFAISFVLHATQLMISCRQYIYIMMVQFNIYIQHDTTFNRNICIHSTIMVFHHLVFFRRHSLCPASLRSSQEAPDMWGTMGTHELGQIPYWTMASVRCLIFWGCNWNSLFWSLLYFFGGWNWNALFLSEVPLQWFRKQSVPFTCSLQTIAGFSSKPDVAKENTKFLEQWIRQ